MTDTPHPDVVQQLRDRLAQVDGMSMATPFYVDQTKLYPRLDLVEAKSQLLADYVVYLLQRIESLEAALREK